ncbi:MAG: c-type cytochrome [Chlorobi bacterium]|nr:c-type cytochrome [Chlorobiota bacterium]
MEENNINQDEIKKEHEIDELTNDRFIANHEYDGIRELDNDLPGWWKWLFYISIIFAVVYIVRYHILKTGDLQEAEYSKEMAVAKEKMPAQSDESALARLEDETNLIAGKAIFDKNCVVCHLSKGEGLVGPNLTDEYWIHGGSFKNIYATIRDGVPVKGMISWKSQLKPEEIQQVSSYIMSLQGTNPPNAKAPQGEKYVP